MNRICLLAILLAVLTALPALAQTAAAPPPAKPAPAPAPAVKPPPPPQLTKDQTAEVNTAFAKAIEANPDLATQANDVQAKFKEWQTAQKAFQPTLNDALVKADPNLADLVASHPNLHPSAPMAPKTPAAPATPKPKPMNSASTNAAPSKPTPPAASTN
jgi:hypothetical protein